jgi:hypothetical protein
MRVLRLMREQERLAPQRQPQPVEPERQEGTSEAMREQSGGSSASGNSSAFGTALLGELGAVAFRSMLASSPIPPAALQGGVRERGSSPGSGRL